MVVRSRKKIEIRLLAVSFLEIFTELNQVYKHIQGYKTLIFNKFLYFSLRFGWSDMCTAVHCRWQ